MSNNYFQYVQTFLQSLGWRTCSYQGTNYFTKRGETGPNSYDFLGSYEFLKYPSPRKFTSLIYIKEVVTNIFENEGFIATKPISVVRKKERTIFASASGQIYDNYVYDRSKTHENKEKRVVFQPCIRLQSHHLVAQIEGFSTSFVNVGAEYWNASIEDHMHSLNIWFNAFSSLGLYVGNITLQRDCQINDWNGTLVPAESLRINYCGLEVGMANYFTNIPQNHGNFATFSNISLGLERLAWAINKTASYFDAIGPLPLIFGLSNEHIDSVRTLTLMAHQGVGGGTEAHGSKFRLLAKKVNSEFFVGNFIYELVDYYYMQWSSFITTIPGNTLPRTYFLIRKELSRNRDIYISTLLNNDIPADKISKEINQDSRLIEKLRYLIKMENK